MPKPFSYQFYHTTAEAWDAMYQAISGAQKSIYWEVYMFADDQAGERFVELLEQEARSGVEVKMVIDALGSRDLTPRGEARLIAAGVKILQFNRFSWALSVSQWWRRLLHRTHRKVLIVDERIAFLGGVNVHSSAREWDDLFVRLQGPLVRRLLRHFALSYLAAGGERREVRHLLHPKLTGEWPAWKQKIRFIWHSPLQRRLPLRHWYARALESAKTSFSLLTPYYVPDRRFLRALARARRRGVKVKIYLPLRPDHKFIELIAHAYYGITHRLGAKLFLLPRMNHGKAWVSDGRAGMVGSYNATPKSAHRREEAAVYFTDEPMVAELNRIFNDWEAGATPFAPESWSRRSWRERWWEWWAKRLERWV